MRVSIKIPQPSTMKVGKEQYRRIAAGTELHRIHLDRFGSADFNGTVNGNARFSPIRDAAGVIIPTIYAAETFECAVCEIILRCPDTPPRNRTIAASPEIVYPTDYRFHAHSRVRTRHDLNLVALTALGQRMIGVNGNALLAGPRSSYGVTRGWAERIHASCRGAQGLFYTSYQYGPEYALLLFGDRVPDDILEPLAKRDVAEPTCHAAIEQLAASLSINYVNL